jgi:Asp-tRNA(Asn)/Glu-tRNA(Gln) amidotransferase A subunit family amidase
MADQIGDREIAYMPVKELHKLYRRKELSPRTAAKVALNRIDAFNDDVNAFRFVDREGAATAAAESEARWSKGEPLGPLDGVPATVKDIVWVKGWTTSYGSDLLAEKAPLVEDAPCVARLREAGAILLGMTQSPEIGWKGVTDSPAHGRAPCISAPTAVGQFVFQRLSPGWSASRRVSGACRPIRPAPSARLPISAHWRAVLRMRWRC